MFPYISPHFSASVFEHFSCLVLCIIGLGQGFALSCGDGVNCVFVDFLGPLGWVDAAHNILFVQSNCAWIASWGPGIGPVWITNQMTFGVCLFFLLVSRMFPRERIVPWIRDQCLCT